MLITHPPPTAAFVQNSKQPHQAIPPLYLHVSPFCIPARAVFSRTHSHHPLFCLGVCPFTCAYILSRSISAAASVSFISFAPELTRQTHFRSSAGVKLTLPWKTCPDSSRTKQLYSFLLHLSALLSLKIPLPVISIRLKKFLQQRDPEILFRSDNKELQLGWGWMLSPGMSLCYSLCPE